jgi:hypothetical protein
METYLMSLLEILFTRSILNKENWGNICDYILDNHSECKEAQMLLSQPGCYTRLLNVVKFLMRRGSTRDIRNMANKAYKHRQYPAVIYYLREKHKGMK